MRKPNFIKAFCFLLALFAVSSKGAQPTCHPTSGVSYCQYNGMVERIYVNDGNLILIYFDTPLDKADAEAQGINVVHDVAAGYSIADNQAYANLLYSTALAAQASGKPIRIQMRGTVHGYLRVDRIWLYK